MAVGMTMAAAGGAAGHVAFRTQKGMYVITNLTFSSLQTSTLDNRMVPLKVGLPNSLNLSGNTNVHIARWF